MTINFASIDGDLNKIITLVVIPSYKEIEALPELIKELHPLLLNTDALLVVDDSPEDLFILLKKRCTDSLGNSKPSIFFINQKNKLGRGAAIRTGMLFGLKHFPNLDRIIECDADGSHRPVDIINLRDGIADCDLLIGSRYLGTSEIIGWSMSRRLFSKMINILIPRLLSIEVSDITNGLRRYSLDATKAILGHEQINKGFTYLSEQALIITRLDMKIRELPIIFVDRTYGKSTVNLKEIVISLKGIFLLVRSRNVYNK